MEEKIEGIVLRSSDYKDTQRLISVFSLTSGLLNLVVKRLSSRNASHLLSTSSFCKAQFVIKRGRSELISCLDVTLLDDHRELRKSYAHLCAAGDLVRAILTSQLPGKPSPDLYRLFQTYLKQIPTFEDLSSLAVSFQLKLLKHEGLLALTSTCSQCEERQASMLVKGESLCLLHEKKESFCFSEMEWKILLALHDARRLNDLRAIKLAPLFFQKLNAYFLSRLSQG